MVTTNLFFVGQPLAFLFFAPALALPRRCCYPEARETLEILVNWCDLCLPANEQAFAEAHRIKIQHFQARLRCLRSPPCLVERTALCNWLSFRAACPACGKGGVAK